MLKKHPLERLNAAHGGVYCILPAATGLPSLLRRTDLHQPSALFAARKQILFPILAFLLIIAQAHAFVKWRMKKSGEKLFSAPLILVPIKRLLIA